jgi:hypothetical protein
MVGALRQSGDGHAADDSSTFHANGKAAAVGGKIHGGQPLFFFQAALLLGEFETDGVGTAMKAGDDVRLAAHPFGLVGYRSGQCCGEEHLTEAADVNHQRIAALDGHLAQTRAKLPCGVFIKVLEDEGRFLTGDEGDIFSDAHEENDCLW